MEKRKNENIYNLFGSFCRGCIFVLFLTRHRPKEKEKMKKFMNALAVVGAIVGIVLLFVLEFYLDGIWGVIMLLLIEIVAVILIRQALILNH